MSRLSRAGHALYTGQVSIDFVGRKRLWYALSALILVVSVLALVLRPLNLGIEFQGGVEYKVAVGSGNADQSTVEAVTRAVQDAGIKNTQINTSGGDAIRVTTEPLTNAESEKVADQIAEAAGVSRADDVSSQLIGPSWGKQVAQRALEGLAVFLVLVVLLIAAYTREWKMSVAAIVALAHDLLITVGVYALSGFEVTPATVTGVLTILGFSLYDTVVVFDKVRENTKNLGRTHRTYAEAANLAVNQSLVRSINTSIVALLPVGALLYVGIFSLGSGALKDLALALFVGMAAGAYSSIFIATPLLVQLKELEPGVRAGDARAERHRSRREVDRFANVPAYTEAMPLHDDPGIEVDGGPDEGAEPRPVNGSAGGPTGRGRGSTRVGLTKGAPGSANGSTNGSAAPAATGAGSRPASSRRSTTDATPDGGRSAGSTALGAARPERPERPSRPTAGERGGSSRPIGDTSGAGRPQPTRKPRSQRGKR